MTRARRREELYGILFAAPWIIGFFLFTFGPMIWSFYLGFTQYAIASPPKWLGIANFQRALGGADSLFWPTLWRTVQYSIVMVPLSIAGSLCAAILLNQNLKATTFLRTLYFLPSLAPVVASAVLWRWLFQPEFGAINTMLFEVGVRGPRWLADAQWAMPSLMVMALWGAIGGSTMVIFLAGLQSVPAELHEAAQIDGATAWQRFWAVTIPMLSPTIFFNLVLRVIAALKVFEAAFVATNGGPNYATWFFIQHLYQNGFQNIEMGYASALAWIFFVLVVSLTYLNVRLSRKWVYYEAEAR